LTSNIEHNIPVGEKLDFLMLQAQLGALGESCIQKMASLHWLLDHWKTEYIWIIDLETTGFKDPVLPTFPRIC